jgi:hypothetical protein
MLDLQTFAFDNTFARDMEGFYVPWQGAKVPAPKSLRVNAPLARELGAPRHEQSWDEQTKQLRWEIHKDDT